MDHRYIDDLSVAQRYLDHTLPPAERARFEAHLVDCQECTDRVLLAGMFQNRNGHTQPQPASGPQQVRAESAPREATGRMRLIVSFTSGQWFALRTGLAALATATAALLAWLFLSSR